MLTGREQKLLDLLAAQAEQKEVEIVTVEVVGSKKAPTVRVYIDTPEGVSFDQLAAAQVWINELMDQEDPFPGAYTLEVSSPGIDRPLRTAEHFARFAGQEAVVKLVEPIEGRSSYTGVIQDVKDQDVVLQVGEDQVVLPLGAMKRARLKGTISFK
ncbi:MAG: ribosome maturation factor RimP [Coriobacteriia bacterium]|nr:ribosome maturation factor RimP [Coriobacteriia bacterium]